MDPVGLGYELLALGAALVVAFPGPGRRRLERAVRRAGEPVTEEGTALLRAYLRRTRRGRAAGVLVAAIWLSFLLYAWFAISLGADTVTGPFAPFALVVLLLGYLAGSALSELTWRLAPSGELRGAQLRVRRLSTYLPGWVPALQRGLAGLGLALLGALLLLVRQPADAPHPLVGSPSWGAVLAGLVVASAVAGEVGQRRVLARPQSWPDAATVRVDDTVRGWSQRHLAAAVAGIQLLLLAQLAMQVLLRVDDVGLTGFA